METLIVVDSPKHWALDIPGTEIVSSRDYLTSSRLFDLKRAKVFNFCRTYGYQTVGYYVSLLAQARGHKPLPSVTTLQDLRAASVLRIVSEDLETQLQRVLAPVKSDRFVLSIYFGRNLDARYDRLCQSLFNHFPAPFLRAEFVLADEWRLHSLRPIATSDIPESHNAFVIEQAQRFLARGQVSCQTKARYDLAVLVNPAEIDAPSNKRALERFVRSAKKFNMDATLIGKEDFGRIGEYDALFIRETTSVNHHTYRLARRAEAEGLVVIDDPESIVRCTNKVYQAELFQRRGIPIPKTMVVHRENAAEVGKLLGFPCVLKRPDSSFSLGVMKVKDEAELGRELATLFEKSELVVAQEFVPSSFDWRVGVLDGKPLFACRYHMAPGHWQIQKAETETSRVYGASDTLAVADAPQAVVNLALRAANLIGNGLYGVDIKEIQCRLVVMEVNDNPSIEAGCEDLVLKDGLYDAVMSSFYERLERRGQKEER